MFSIEITLSRRFDGRRALYPWLAAAGLTAASIGLGYSLPILQINGRWLYEAPWRQFTPWAGCILCLIAALGAIVAHRWRVVDAHDFQFHLISPLVDIASACHLVV